MSALSIAPGLDLFAAAWIEKWTANGGIALMEPGGSAWIGFPPYESSRSYAEPSATLPEEVRIRQREYCSARYDGEMRGLLDLLRLFPGGDDAVTQHVSAYPEPVSTNGFGGIL